MIKHRNFDMLNLSDSYALLVVDYIKYSPRGNEVAACPKILP